MIRWPYKLRKKEGCPFRIPHLAGLIYKWDCIAENCFIRCAPLPMNGVNTNEVRLEKVVVSLTSFPGRIAECYYAIKSLMIQRYQADRIILWLAESQFPNRILPKQFEQLLERGLEVRYCADLRSHKKYYYMLQEQKKDELVITFDDDIIYDYDAIKRLVDTHNIYPDCIICNRGHHITVSNDGIDTYKKWRICSPEGVQKPSKYIMPSTGAGCLYPYNVMPKTTFDIEQIKQNAYTADDIWMCFNRLTTDVRVVKTMEKIPILCSVFGSQEETLTSLNDIQHENERTIERMCVIFPVAISNLMANE